MSNLTECIIVPEKCGATITKCQIQGCRNIAEFEAWFRVRDPTFGTPTGKIQLFCACRSCVKMSIAFENGKTPDLDKLR